jgi:flagellar L-ring protein precursor FlgH
MTRFCFLTGLAAMVLGAALWGAAPAAAQSLYSDPKARQPGDVITILLAEQTAAQRESGYSGSSESSLGGSGSVLAPGISSTFSGDAEITSGTDNRNETVQSDLLEGTMTARVAGVDESGNLLIEGERRLNVNGVTHVMQVEGTVRPLDVRYDNTVLSHQIANANIKYDQLGVRHRIFDTSTMLKVGATAALGLGIFLGIQ